MGLQKLFISYLVYCFLANFKLKPLSVCHWFCLVDLDSFITIGAKSLIVDK